MSWAGLARRAAELAGLDSRAVTPVRADSFAWAAERPAYSVLGSERGALLRPLEEALSCYMRERGCGESLAARA